MDALLALLPGADANADAELLAAPPTDTEPTEGPPTKRLKDNIDNSARAIDNAHNAAVVATQWTAKAKQFTGALSDALGDLQEQHKTAIDSIKEERDAAKSDLDESQQKVDEAQSKLTEKTAELSAKTAELMEALEQNKEVGSLKQDIQELNGALDSLRQENADLQQQVKTNMEKSEKVNKLYDDQREEMETLLIKQAAQAQAEATRSRMSVQELKKQEHYMLTNIESFDAELSEMRTRLAEMKSGIKERFAEAIKGYNQPEEISATGAQTNEADDIEDSASTAASTSASISAYSRYSNQSFQPTGEVEHVLKTLPNQFTKWAKSRNADRFAVFHDFLIGNGQGFEPSRGATAISTDNFVRAFYKVSRGLEGEFVLNGKSVEFVGKFLHATFDVFLDPSSDKSGKNSTVNTKDKYVASFLIFLRKHMSAMANDKDSELYKARQRLLAKHQ